MVGGGEKLLWHEREELGVSVGRTRTKASMAATVSQSLKETLQQWISL